jgi:nitrous oxidase accessory protein NosD
MLRIVSALAAAVACAIVFAGPAAAADTIYVSPFPAGLPGTGQSCALPDYNSIQAAVSSPTTLAGDTIVVCDGVYTEEVTVTKSLTLIGSGNAVIQAPSTIAPAGDLVEIRGGATVVMSGFVVRGPGPSGCGSIGAGIRVTEDATLDLSASTIRDIRDQGNSGCQNGEGIRVGQRGGVGTPGHLVADNVAVTNYQKNGITISGPGSTAKVTNTTVTGSGAISYIAQNGIQVSSGAAATISTSTIRDHNYVPKTFVACGLLVFDAAGVNDDNNVYLNNEKDKCVVNGRGGTYEGA